ncbi:MAG: DUF5916 domain-containing protein, partial [Pseudomonadota bacterium]
MAAPAIPRTITARRTDHPPTLDGRLDEAEWALAELATDFVQSDPHEGQPMTERTEVRVLFDDKNLYVGIYCYDSQPSGIVTNDLKYDFDSQETDALGVGIDPLHDHRNVFTFFTNPGGAQRDLQAIGDSTYANLNWDGIWYVGVRIQPDGWSCEYAIPFKTLGLKSHGDHSMGIEFKRRIRRKNEEGYWNLIPRRFSVSRASFYGDILGLDAEVSAGRNFRIKPFATADFTRTESGGTKDDHAKLKVGIDGKHRVSEGLTLDLTYNTDFSQVEVDTQQINLTRFSLFYAEKRDFFLENAGMFQFGDVPSERGTRSEETQLFYSRRIGLSAGGKPLPLRGGARLSGRASHFSLGLLNIQQDELEDELGAIPSNNFTVARVRRDLFARSDVGVIFINRQGGNPDDYNRSYGVDINLQFLHRLKINSYWAGTQSPGAQNKNYETKFSAAWDDGFWLAKAIFADIGENFRPEVGFVPRTGVRNYESNFGTKLRPKGNGFFREFYPHVGIKYFTDRRNTTLTKNQYYGMLILFRDGSTLEASHNPQFDRLLDPFRIRKGVNIPVGDYYFNEFRLDYSSDLSKLLAGSVSFSRGGFYDGRKTSSQFTGILTVKPHFSASASYTYNLVDLKEGRFRADLYALR